MQARPFLIVAAVLTCASVATAEPTKPASREINSNHVRSAAVVLASAEQVPTRIPAAAQDSNAAPTKPARRGRVTTCRCADQVQH